VVTGVVALNPLGPDQAYVTPEVVELPVSVTLVVLQDSLSETLADTPPGTFVFWVTAGAEVDVKQPLDGLVTVTV
jgi:hypothetical protein